jgi:hypothetical protein
LRETTAVGPSVAKAMQTIDLPSLRTHQRPGSIAACPTDQSAHEAASAPVRSFGSPSSNVTPNVSTTACPSDISIGDGSDISIGDLQVNAAESAITLSVNIRPGRRLAETFLELHDVTSHRLILMKPNRIPASYQPFGD